MTSFSCIRNRSCIWRRGVLLFAYFVCLFFSCENTFIKAYRGDTGAQLQLGTAAFFAGDDVTAIKWFERAAKSGDVSGMREACDLRYWGGTAAGDKTGGGIRDRKLARMWCSKASENGEPLGSYYLARLHLDSHEDDSQQLALPLLSIAVESGDPSVTFLIAQLEEAFCGVDIDTPECIEYLKILNSKPATDRRRR